MVWSDECLGRRGKDCTYQSLNCKLLFVRITAHSRLHTKNLKSTELAGSRGTRQSFLGTRGPCACCFREHCVLGKERSTGAFALELGQRARRKSKEVPVVRRTEIVCQEKPTSTDSVLSARAEPIPERFVWVKSKLLPPRTRTRMSTLSPNLP